ncbi:WG repeat-containing protein [Sphingobacterium pedocola]|uniref:J domain-containing protein n=1 Tax=Sphingobacterium pedocola TaxID=2082722 RepID=A0ABR9T9E2_9SPHI|nr:WG repeat-containing protein [Sphingobacterium pedocola]MBE8721956.1 hypothetical protein [Sphingobacterium pedocola]
MNKEQAYERLELPVGTDLQTVRKKFAEMHNDYRMRIENAPTPRLKQTFERGLEELKEAYALLNESERMDDVAELPRTERSFEQEEAVEKKAATASLKMDLPQAPAATDKPKQPIWAYVLIGALLVAAMGYFLLRPDAAQNVSSTDSFTAAKDSTAWEAALAGHSTATYQHYLSSYPDGIFAAVAKDSLAKRNDAPSSENTAVELAITTVQQTDQVDTEATRRLAEQQKKRIAELEQQNREQTVAQDADVDLPAGANTNWRSKYDKIYEFYDGLARAGLNDKWGFVDKNGREITPIKFQSVGDFRSGLARVKLNEKWGFIDKIGGNVVSPKYEFADGFREGFARVQLNKVWGYIDKTGREIIYPKYEFAENFSEGLAAVSPNQKAQWGFIDNADREVIPLKYDFARSFSEGLAAVKLNGKWGFIDKTGRVVIPLKYRSALPFYKGRGKVELDGKEFFINRQDECVADCPD